MLDPKNFEITAGQKTVDWMEELTAAAMAGGATLTDTQEELFRDGYRGAELIKNNQGWVLRSDTGLDNFMILAGSKEAWLYEEALEASKRWFVGDATHRYVYTRRTSMEGHLTKIEWEDEKPVLHREQS